MTDNEIIKALECCLSGKDYDTACMKCPIEPICESDDILLKYALDLINRQQAEIERLKEFIVETRRCDKEIKSEAIKEFAERLKETITKAIDTYYTSNGGGYYLAEDVEV